MAIIMRKNLSLRQIVDRLLLLILLWSLLSSICSTIISNLIPDASQYFYAVVVNCVRFFSFYIPMKFFLGKCPKFCRSNSFKIENLCWIFVLLGIYLLSRSVLEYCGILQTMGISYRRITEIPYLYYAWFFLFSTLWEEIIFRKYIVSYMATINQTLAILISSYLFAMLHANLVTAPSSFIFGLLAGYTYTVTGSVIFPYLIHFGVNFFTNTYFNFYTILTHMQGYDLYLIIFISLCLIFLSLIILNAHAHKTHSPGIFLSCRNLCHTIFLLRHELWTVFTSPGMVLAHLIFFIFGLIQTTSMFL